MRGGGTQSQDREELEALRRALTESQERARIFEQQCQALEAERQTMVQRVQELEHQLKRRSQNIGNTLGSEHR